jgi:glycosyltransferase involved in cell wall biosynthesis
VKVDDYLPRIDVIALTSISEGQPLVVLEAGAAGIPSVCTDVGDCRALIYGRPNEEPPLGAGGIVTLLTDPIQVGRSILALLTDPQYYKHCSSTIKQRVETYYKMERQTNAYLHLYQSFLR